MMNRYRTALSTAFCIALLTGILSLCSTPLRGQDPATITPEELTTVWTRQRDTIRSGRFAWTVKRWIRKGSFSGRDSAPGAPNILPTSFPTEDTTFEFHHTLVFDGSLIRHESRGPIFDHRSSSFKDGHFVSVWDGNEGRVYRDGRGVPSGHLYAFNWGVTQPELRAFQYAFRMSDPQWFTLDPREHIVTDRNAVMGGFRCILLETAPDVLQSRAQGGGRAWKSSYWCSPERGYAVVRYTLTWRDLTNADTTISYKHDAEHGWYPERWTQVVESHRAPARIDDATVSEYSLNITIDPEQFQYEFPEGTVIFDERSKEYVLQRENDRRRITTDELTRGATYEEIRATEEGMARAGDGRNITSSKRPWLWWACTALVVLAGSVIWSRLAQRRRRH